MRIFSKSLTILIVLIAFLIIFYCARMGPNIEALTNVVKQCTEDIKWELNNETLTNKCVNGTYMCAYDSNANAYCPGTMNCNSTTNKCEPPSK